MYVTVQTYCALTFKLASQLAAEDIYIVIEPVLAHVMGILILLNRGFEIISWRCI